MTVKNIFFVVMGVGEYSLKNPKNGKIKPRWDKHHTFCKTWSFSLFRIYSMDILVLMCANLMANHEIFYKPHSNEETL